MMIQNVQSQDFESIYSIYQDYVQNSTAIFDLKPMEYSLFQKRMETISSNYPFLIAKVQDEVIGYGYVHAAFEKKRTNNVWNRQFISKKEIIMVWLKR